MNALAIRDELCANLQEMLEWLQDYAPDPAVAAADALPLATLIAQCEALCTPAPPAPKIRSIHHFACSGGTLISRCIAAMPNVTLLSEVDPLSQMQIHQPGKRLFLPTDLIYGASVSLRPVGRETVAAMFTAALAELHKALALQGRYLVLRDHAHSQFCSDTAPPDRATLHELLTRTGPVLSVVTVRHPLDCFLSLLANGWVTFTPGTLDDYARRHLNFLDRHRGLPLFRYEDFVADTEGELQRICSVLELPYLPDASSLLSVVSLSGDSGRSSAQVTARPRREVPLELDAVLEKSPCYIELCARLGYALSAEPITSETPA